jgi:carboxylesterase type B
MGAGPNYRINMEKQFRCGAAESAEYRSKLNVPAYRYLFANNKPGATQGATHGDEIPFVFGNRKPGYSDIFQPIWASFAKDPVNGLKSHSWKTYNVKGNSISLQSL